jgi:hypothetical protein
MTLPVQGATLDLYLFHLPYPLERNTGDVLINTPLDTLPFE